MAKGFQVAVTMVMLACSVFSQNKAEPGETRFGPVDFDQNEMLAFHGQRVKPEIQGGRGTFLSEAYRMGTTDVVLVTKAGGTACPVRYYFVAVSEAGAKATGSFGTCNEATSIEHKGDSIVLKMQGFLGPFEAEDKRKKAFGERHVFVYRDGIVTDNGKSVQ